MWSVGFFVPVVFAFLSLVMLFYDESFLVTWSIFLVEGEMSVVLYVDPLVKVFFFTISLVSASVLIYADSYMSGDISKKKFSSVMVVFIISMLVLVCSGDLFWVMIGWDGLGLSSFLLIVHYQNWKSLNSAMVTFLMNRAGDCFILMSISWSLFALPSWSLESLENWGAMFVMMGAFSKSAQVPFSAWLPLAMAAPTPVSSLVHSSTLVTAGVFLVIRFWHYVSIVSSVIFVVSLLTIMVAGFSSLMEMDLKKVIAFSTLSHIGLMMFSVSLGAFEGATLHLAVHAFFKSLLFMICGEIIHWGAGSQDVRKLGVCALSFPSGVCFVVSLLSMMGAPFLSGFYSKEAIYGILSVKSVSSLWFFVLAAGLTSSYSVRLLTYLFKNSLMSSPMLPLTKNEIVFFIMTIHSMGGGVLISLSEGKSLVKSFFLLTNAKFVLFVFMVVGIVVGLFVSFLSSLQVSSFFHEMWFMFYVSAFPQKALVQLAWLFMFKESTKGMLDSMVHSTGLTLQSISLKSLGQVFMPMLVMEEAVWVIFMSMLFMWGFNTMSVCLASNQKVSSEKSQVY